MKINKNITMDEEVYKRISEYAKENGISFSGALSVLAGQALNAVKGVESIKQLTDMMEKVQKQSGRGWRGMQHRKRSSVRNTLPAPALIRAGVLGTPEEGPQGNRSGSRPELVSVCTLAMLAIFRPPYT